MNQQQHNRRKNNNETCSDKNHSRLNSFRVELQKEKDFYNNNMQFVCCLD